MQLPRNEILRCMSRIGVLSRALVFKVIFGQRFVHLYEFSKRERIQGTGYSTIKEKKVGKKYVLQNLL